MICDVVCHFVLVRFFSLNKYTNVASMWYTAGDTRNALRQLTPTPLPGVGCALSALPARAISDTLTTVPAAGAIRHY